MRSWWWTRSGSGWWRPRWWRKLTTAILAALTRYHQDNPLKTGLAREELRSGFKPPVDPKLFQHALDTLLKKKEIVQEQAEVRLAGFAVTLQVDEQELQNKILGLYRQGGLTPPILSEVHGQDCGTSRKSRSCRSSPCSSRTRNW